MEPKPPRRNPAARTSSSASTVGDAAFEEWLARGLRRLYGDASEPPPRELLDLIEHDREKAKRGREPDAE